MLRPAEVDPGFKICLNTIAVSKVKDTPPIFVWEVWIWMNLGSRPLSQCSFNFRAIGLKLVKCFGFWTLLIFCYTTHLEPMVSLCTAITYFLLTKQRLRNPNQIFFLNLSMGTSPKKNSRWKFSATERFINFLARAGKKSIEAVCAQFWCHWSSTFEPLYTRKISAVPLKFTWCQRLNSPVPSKVR